MDNVANRSRQLNPCDELYWKSRGYSERPSNWREILESSSYSENNNKDCSYKDQDDNLFKSLQKNPNNIEFWKSKGWSYRPDDWHERIYGYDEDSSEEDEDSDSYEEEDEYESCDEDDDYDSDEDDSEETDEDYEYNRLKSLQNNPNNIEYWRVRGYSFRPSNWRELVYN